MRDILSIAAGKHENKHFGFRFHEKLKLENT